MVAIRALIFDFDGLILDTEYPEYQSWCDAYVTYGCELTRAVWTDCIGRGWDAFDPYAYLETLAGRPIDRDAVRAVRRARYEALMAAQRVLPGVRDYLAEGARRGLKCGVASSSPRTYIIDHLRRLELLDAFHAVCCADDVGAAKPDPATYLAVLAQVGVTPGEAIAFEDSPNGIAAAKAAGLYCVAVPNAMTADLPLHQADRRITSLADVPPARLLAEVESISAQSVRP